MHNIWTPFGPCLLFSFLNGNSCASIAWACKTQLIRCSNWYQYYESMNNGLAFITCLGYLVDNPVEMTCIQSHWENTLASLSFCQRFYDSTTSICMYWIWCSLLYMHTKAALAWSHPKRHLQYCFISLFTTTRDLISLRTMRCQSFSYSKTVKKWCHVRAVYTDECELNERNILTTPIYMTILRRLRTHLVWSTDRPAVPLICGRPFLLAESDRVDQMRKVRSRLETAM